MSANVSLDTALKPFVIGTNVSVNALTKLFRSCLNPKWDALRKSSYAAVFHYDVKVTLFNGATALLAYNIFRVLGGGNRSLRSNILHLSVVLFLRAVIGQSLSISSGAKSIFKGVVTSITGGESLEEVSITDNAFTSICIVGAAAQSLRKNSKWEKDILQVQGYSILKNWATFPK